VKDFSKSKRQDAVIKCSQRLVKCKDVMMDYIKGIEQTSQGAIFPLFLFSLHQDRQNAFVR